MDLPPAAQLPLDVLYDPPLAISLKDHTLLVPSLAAACSVVILLASGRGLRHNGAGSKSPNSRAILKCNILRLSACATLLGFSIASLFIRASWPNLALCFFYLYALLLAGSATLSWPAVSLHLNCLLAIAFGVLFYRDIFPLATYTWPVEDAAEGPLLAGKLILLTFAAIILPLVTPRTYTPVDPQNPMPEPNAEQTASLLSLIMFSFLDPLVWTAYKAPQLPFEAFPPLADTDDARNLRTQAFPNIDPFSGARRRHLFFGILKTYRKEYDMIIPLLIGYNLSTFAAPLGINRVLAYLESDTPSESTVRPIVWILWLALGPLSGSVMYALYYSLSLRTLLRLEGVLSALIFEHALRVRVKAQTAADDTPAAVAEGARSSIDTGKIANLATSDLRNVVNSVDLMMLLFGVPLKLVLGITFLCVVLGWSSIVGLVILLVLTPVSVFTTRLQHRIRKSLSRAGDARVGAISETMNALRMVKLFAWEGKMLARVNEKRETELGWIWRREILQLVADVFSNLIPVLAMLATYTVVMKQELRPSIVFSTVPIFNMLRIQLGDINWRIIQFVDAKVSLDRIDDFLHKTELLDSFAEDERTTMPDGEEIGFRDATFRWSNDGNGLATPPDYQFALRIKGELLFKRGCINLIVGPTGAGKTSLLMALLGEMHFIPSAPGSTYNLPRGGGVAYAAQESWILNQTIRENILFRSDYDEARYKKVLSQCALERDLELFEAGDRTEVGEKGLTLSGGQKARCTLARAIYSSAEILLLDDVLAALDVHTSKWIVEKCLAGDLVQGRTVILVSHNVALVAPIAEFTVAVGLNGRILSQGSVKDALQRSAVLADEARADLEVLEQAAEGQSADLAPKSETAEGKLILAEEVQLGRVKWSAVALYLSGLGGVGFYAIFLSFTVLSKLAEIAETWYLGYFASLYETSAPGTVPVSYHMGVYGLIILLDTVTRSYATVMFSYAVLRASRGIHRKLLEAILGTTLRWLDTTPASRVIARFTTDISAVDGSIIKVSVAFILCTISILSAFGAVVLFTPLFSVPGVFAAVIGGALGQVFIKAQLSVKRETSNAKAPVLGHMDAAIAGLTSIRAYGAQGPFIEESLRRVNKYTRAARTLANLDRWIGVRLAAISNVLAAMLATYLVYFHKERSNNVGFSLSMAANFSGQIFLWVRLWNKVQIEGNSLERIQQFIEIEQETKPTALGRPPAHWPRSGELVVERLSARYSGGPKVLHDISFRVNSGERVGIVGRTGSGKSSLTLALLRCIQTEGTVYFDGISTSSINLDALRSKITIIPQMPELLSGTLRHNLDPFEQYDDSALNDSLRAAGLFSLQHEMEEGQLMLDSLISSGGQNLSVGQRQIIALARAILRDSKLLILDEATSAIDYKTDSTIQTSLRTALKPDVTVITIAHRLQTILDYDKILLLDEGRIIEFDAPENLLKDPKGHLRALVDASGDKGMLYAMAESKRRNYI